MDQITVDTYDAEARRYAKEWIPKTPVQIQALVKHYFKPPGLVMDVGTGTGREIRWLRENGFDVRGVDASQSLLELAQKSNPDVLFLHDSLPDLVRVEDESMDFVLCSAVLMHLPKSDVPRAVSSLLRILKFGGRVICSVRPSREQSDRESDGRLYTSLSLSDLREAFTAHGARVIFAEAPRTDVNARHWQTVVAEKILSHGR